MHGQEVTGVVGADRSLPSLHLVIELVHEEALVNAVGLGVSNQLVGRPDLRLICGVDRVAQVEQGRADGVPGVADHAHLAGVLPVKEGGPAGDLPVHHGGVVDDAQGTPGVGDRIFVLRVVAQVLILTVNEAEIGDIAVIQLRQHPLRDHLANHVVAGHDYVIVRAALLNQGVHGFVALSGLVVDPDSGLLLKLADQVRIDVLPPAAHIDNPVAVPAAASQAEGHRQGERQ